MHLYIGTSGYSYKHWKGRFYPEQLPNKDMLRYYSANLTAVEINSTFYRLPGPIMLGAWLGQVPPDFRFILKAPRKITHSNPLKNKDNEIKSLFKTAAIVGGKLGAILFQTPPDLRKDSGLLSAFADLLPAGMRSAIEFRHASWFDDETYAILQARGLALCVLDGANTELRPLVATADWGYLRLRRPAYSEGDLIEWAQRIHLQNWRTAFVVFRHEKAGTGPAMAGQLLRLAGQSLAG